MALYKTREVTFDFLPTTTDLVTTYNLPGNTYFYSAQKVIKRYLVR